MMKTSKEKRQFEYILTKTTPEVSKILKKRIEPAFQKQIPWIKQNKRHLAVVGFSGGADSIATLYLSKRLGLNPIALNLDYDFMPSYNKSILKTVSKKLNVPLVFFKPEKSYYNNITEVLRHGKKPCKICVKMKVDALIKYAKRNKIPLLVLGDFVSIGKKSITLQEKIVRINLPAMLSMKEWELIDISKKITKSEVAYACPVPYMLPDIGFEINDRLKSFWVNKLIKWSYNMDKELFFKLIKNVVH